MKKKARVARPLKQPPPSLQDEMKSFNATDVIAILIIAGGFVLLAMHIDTVVGGVITLVAGFYFGRKSDGRR